MIRQENSPFVITAATPGADAGDDDVNVGLASIANEIDELRCLPQVVGEAVVTVQKHLQASRRWCCGRRCGLLKGDQGGDK